MIAWEPTVSGPCGRAVAPPTQGCERPRQYSSAVQHPASFNRQPGAVEKSRQGFYEVESATALRTQGSDVMAVHATPQVARDQGERQRQLAVGRDSRERPAPTPSASAGEINTKERITVDNAGRILTGGAPHYAAPVDEGDICPVCFSPHPEPHDEDCPRRRPQAAVELIEAASDAWLPLPAQGELPLRVVLDDSTPF